MTSPLARKRVLVLRAESQSDDAADLLRSKGAEPVLVPAIAIGPPDDEAPALFAISKLATYDWVAFTSANGVERTWELFDRAGKDASAFGDAKLAAVGPATGAALARHGLTAHVTAKELRGEGLAAAMLEAMGGPGRVLLLRAQSARDALPDALRAAGCAVDIAAVYATRAPADLAGTLRPVFAEGAARVDAVIFSSSSTVQHVCDALGAEAASLLAAVCVVAIGPVTGQTARSLGVRVDAEAAPYTMAAAIDALEQLCENLAPASPPTSPPRG
jgi:uroporphyrinogen III methyltransferase/synthase